MARLRSDLERMSLHLVRLDGAAVATFSLLESDALFWPSARSNALYLHRFAVRRVNAGVGAHVVAWVMAEARRRERAYVRLDCLAENPGIRRYYERLGFASVGEKLIDEVRFSLYEMPVMPSASARPSQ